MSHQRWKQDELGFYLEMIVGDREEFGVDATNILNGESISSTVLNLDPNITQFGTTQVVGNVISFVLVAGAVGTWECDLKINGDTAVIRFLPFRVVVKEL